MDKLGLLLLGVVLSVMGILLYAVYVNEKAESKRRKKR